MSFPASKTINGFLVCCVAVLLLTAGWADAQQPRPFKFNNLPKFDLGNEFDLDSPTEDEDPKVEARLLASEEDPSKLGLIIEVKLPSEKSYTYSMDRGFGGHTYVTLETLEGANLTDRGFASKREPKVEIEPLFDNAKLEKFYGTASWLRELRVKSDATAVSVSGSIEFTMCNEHVCRKYTEPFQVTKVILAKNDEDTQEAAAMPFASSDDAIELDDLEAVPFGEVLEQEPLEEEGLDESEAVPFAASEESSKQPADNTSEPATTASEPNTGTDAKQENQESVSPTTTDNTLDISWANLIPIIIGSFGAGVLALLTPCVYPMIPITVSFFLKESEKGKHSPIFLASVYAFGIMFAFVVPSILLAKLFGSAAPNDVANNVWLNIGLAAMFVFFGLSFLGMFEIRIPSFLLTWSSKQESRGGLLGIFFMAMTLALVSFTCTFAIVGSLLTAVNDGKLLVPAIGMLSFSTAFALPFFFLALFPSYVTKMPKSGGWMNKVKVVLGIVEIGAAFKFLSVADISWNGTPYYLDYSLVMVTWMVLSLIAGLYLLGAFRLAHDTKQETISTVQFACAVLFLGFGTYLAVGTFNPNKPTGFIWEQIEAFAPPQFEFEAGPSTAPQPAAPMVADNGQAVDLGPVLYEDGLAYALDLDKAREYAKATNRPLFLDFTGVNCVNCRRMEKSVIPRPENRQLLENFVRVKLYCDTAVPGIDDRERARELRERYVQLQEEWLKDVTLPLYVVTPPDDDAILSRLSGYNSGEGVFTGFLRQGLERYEQVVANQPKTVMR